MINDISHTYSSEKSMFIYVFHFIALAFAEMKNKNKNIIIMFLLFIYLPKYCVRRELLSAFNSVIYKWIFYI